MGVCSVSHGADPTLDAHYFGVILSGWKADLWFCHFPQAPRGSGTWTPCAAGPQISLSQQSGTHDVSIQDTQDDQEARNCCSNRPQGLCIPGCHETRRALRPAGRPAHLPGAETYPALEHSDQRAWCVALVC